MIYSQSEQMNIQAKATAAQIRLSPSDKDRLQQAAKLLGVSMSAFIRFHALQAANTLQTDCKHSDLV